MSSMASFNHFVLAQRFWTRTSAYVTDPALNFQQLSDVRFFLFHIYAGEVFQGKVFWFRRLVSNRIKNNK